MLDALHTFSLIFIKHPYKVGIHIAIIYCRLPAGNRWPTQIRIICEEFNKGTICKSMVRVREIPSIGCLGLVTVELLCYKSKTGGGGKGVGVGNREGCLRMLSTGVWSVKGWGSSTAILQQWSKGDKYSKVTHFSFSLILHLEARGQGGLFTFPNSAGWIE